jgi:hypothetical protein
VQDGGLEVFQCLLCHSCALHTAVVETSIDESVYIQQCQGGGETSVEKVRMDDLHFTQNASQGVPAIIGRTKCIVIQVYRLPKTTDTLLFGRFRSIITDECLGFTADMLFEPLTSSDVCIFPAVDELTPCRNLAESFGVLFLVS